MANEYLISKWKMWFKWLDINIDGKLDSQDMEAARTRYVELNNLEGEQRKAALDTFEKWWMDFIFSGKVQLREEDLVRSFNEEITADRDKFVEKMLRCFQVAFNVVDLNGEAVINVEEFIMGFRTSGHENMELNKAFFRMYQPENDVVPVQKLVESWVQFTTCDDIAKKDVVKSAFELGV